MGTTVGTKWRKVTIGHRISWHEKCGRMHGHQISVRVELDGNIDQGTGMVVDFSVVGKALSEIIEPWDHKFLADKRAVSVEQIRMIVNGGESPSIDVGESYIIDEKYVLPHGDVVVLPIDIVSSENVAWYIWNQLCSQPWAQNRVLKVQVSESDENIAEASSFVGTAVINYPSTLEWYPAYPWLSTSAGTDTGSAVIFTKT